MIATRLLVLTVVIFLICMPITSEAAVVYTDRTLFEAAVGTPVLVEDWEAFPLNAEGYGAFSNGYSFGYFSVASLSLSSDVSLRDTDLAPTGLAGTFLVDEVADGANVAVRPGGQGGVGSPEDDDDFRIDFAVPTNAAGLLIMNNRTDEGGESVEFLGPADAVIATAALPGGTAGSGSPGFIGVTREPGDPPIAAIVVYEGSTMDDDILFDDVVFQTPVSVPAIGHPGLILMALLLAAAALIARRPRGTIG